MDLPKGKRTPFSSEHSLKLHKCVKVTSSKDFKVSYVSMRRDVQEQEGILRLRAETELKRGGWRDVKVSFGNSLPWKDCG